MAFLPILDVLPFHAAQQNGYFDQLDLQVELVPVKSAQERDTLMQTGHVDGMLAELLAPALFNQDEAQISIVRTASGLGYYIIVESWGRLAYPEMYAGVLAMSLLGLALYFAVDRLQAQLCPWLAVS